MDIRLKYFQESYKSVFEANANPEVYNKVIALHANSKESLADAEKWLHSNFPTFKGDVGGLYNKVFGDGDVTNLQITPDMFAKFGDKIGLNQKGFNIENSDVDKILSGVKDVSSGVYGYIVKLWKYLDEQAKLLSHGHEHEAQIQLGIKFIVVALGLLFLTSGSKHHSRYEHTKIDNKDKEYLSESLSGTLSGVYNGMAKKSIATSAASFGLQIISFFLMLTGGTILFNAFSEK